MPSPNIQTAYVFISLAGALLSVYWAFTLSQDQASRYVPWPIMFARRITLTAMGVALMISVSYGWERGWQPWPPYICIVGALDLYLLVSIISAHIRNKVCSKCPLIAYSPKEARRIVQSGVLSH